MSKTNVVLRTALDMATEGALYALHYEARGNGWDPHVWAQKLPGDKSRFIFYATDREGRAQYFDYMTVQDTGTLADLVTIDETMREAKTAEARVREGLARLDVDLDPVPYPVDTERLD